MVPILTQLVGISKLKIKILNQDYEITCNTGDENDLIKSSELLNEKMSEIKNSGKTIIKVSDRYFRPTEVESLLGDATKAKEKLGWEPKISFKKLVEDMCIYGQ